ncbi:MAG: nucleotidyltransferase domain-containing protein [Candidatus Thorarchaeota archaeon]
MNTIQQQLVYLCKQFKVDFFYAFGSRAVEVKASVENNVPLDEFMKSDLDIGVKTRPDVRLSLDDKVQLTQALEDIFDISRVDLIDLKQADPFLALDIVKGELLYSRDDDVQAEYELFILRRAGDLAYYARGRWNQILGIE